MVVIKQAAGLFQQIANANFFAVALASDVMLIRFFLCCSYVALLIASFLGMPTWPGVAPNGTLAIDALVWAVLCLIFHGHAFARLVLDERRIWFKTEDQEQLWRFFYRRGGMGRLEMKQALRYGQWLRVPAGAEISHGASAHLRFFVLVEGRATVSSYSKGLLQAPRLLVSGSCFDMGLLSVFGVSNGMAKGEEHSMSVHAASDCLLYSWTIDELVVMATQLAPAVGNYFRNFTLAQLGHMLHSALYPNSDLLCATGEPEHKGVVTGDARSRDFTDPLRPYEVQRTTVAGFLAWLKRSFNPFPPAGLRHNALPITGIMARNRLVAVKACKAQAAIEAADEASGWDEELAGAESSAAPVGAVVEILERMQTLRQLDSTTVEALLERAATQVGTMRGMSRLRVAASAKRGSSTQSSLDPRGSLAAHGSSGGSPAMSPRNSRYSKQR